MADWDWVKSAAQIAAPLITGIAGLFLGTWQAGKRQGKQESDAEAKLKAEIAKELDAKIEGFKAEMRTAVAEALEANEAFIKSVGDSFSALRQKINDVELETERRFLPRASFDSFVEEYRENQRRTDDKLDKLLGLNGAGRGRQ